MLQGIDPEHIPGQHTRCELLLHGRSHARRIHPQLDLESIGRQACVEAVIERPVGVLQIGVAYRTEARDVEMSVGGQQRVESPCDQLNPLCGHIVPLKPLECKAKALVAEIGMHAELVRAVFELRRVHAFVETQKAKDESCKPVPDERPSQQPAVVRRGQKHVAGHLAGSPDGTLQLDDSISVLRCVQMADIGHHYSASPPRSRGDGS